MIKVSVLNENTAGRRGFLAEHGLSLLLETQGIRLLFDTGQSEVFWKNAERSGEDLLKLDAIILSHGHFDHCGGMEEAARRYHDAGKKLPPVYVRDSAFRCKNVLDDPGKTLRNIGISWKKQMLADASRPAGELEKIADNIWLLGNVPYTTDFEKRPEQFFIEEDGVRIPDYMKDEQLLVIETEKGLCVFAGCCHAGIINCLHYVKAAFPGRPLHSVFAGMHLKNQNQERISGTIEALQKMELSILVPMHCTGLEAIGRIKCALGDRCLLAETGSVFEII